MYYRVYCLQHYTHTNAKSQLNSHELAFLVSGSLGVQTLTAGLLAAAAGFRALPAVLHMRAVLFAFVTTGLADFGALAQQVLGVLRAAGQQTSGEGADVGTVPVQANTADHHAHILLLQAGGSAVFARGDAGIEGVEQVLVLSVHDTGRLRMNNFQYVLAVQPVVVHD
jgi:hypothetical protein